MSGKVAGKGEQAFSQSLIIALLVQQFGEETAPKSLSFFHSYIS